MNIMVFCKQEGPNGISNILYMRRKKRNSALRNSALDSMRNPVCFMERITMIPFQYGCVVTGDHFCPRPELEAQLIEHALSGQNLVIQSGHRMEKTSLAGDGRTVDCPFGHFVYFS